MSERPDAPFRIVALGGGRFLVDDGRRRRLACGVRDGASIWVFLDGRVHVVAEAGPRRRAARGDLASLAAPMPATVIRVDAGPGQRVSAGDLLVVLEAMKMELPLKAPRDGVVAAVHCSPGDIVQPGVPLVTLE